MSKKKKKYNYRDRLEIGVSPRTKLEHLYMLIIIVYYESMFREKKPKNMIKYMNKHHKSLIKEYPNLANLKQYFRG